MAQKENYTFPEEIVTREKWRPLIIMVLGVLSLLLLANFLAGFYVHSLAGNQGMTVVQNKWQWVQNTTKPVDCLILGDSSGNQGVMPEILQQKLGWSTYNLCTTGNMLAVGDAWMLMTYLEKFKPPKAVLIIHVYDVWPRTEIDESSMMQIPVDPEVLRAFDPSFFRLAVPAHNGQATTLKQRIKQKTYLYSFPVTLGAFLQYPWKRHYVPEICADGFMVYDLTVPGLVAQDCSEHLEFIKNRFTLSQANGKALDQISRLSAEKGFDVYIMNGPVYEHLWKSDLFKTYYSDVDKMLYKYASSNPRIHYIMHPPMTFPVNKLATAVDHVTSSGAREFTNRIAENILSLSKKKI